MTRDIPLSPPIQWTVTTAPGIWGMIKKQFITCFRSQIRPTEFPWTPKNRSRKNDQRLTSQHMIAIDHQPETTVEKIGCPPTEEHFGHKYLKILHN